MLKLLKQYKKLLVVLSFPYVYLLMILVMPTGFAGTAPGGLRNVNESFDIEGIVLVDQFHVVYVLTYYPLTPFLSWVMNQNQNMSINEMTARQRDTSWADEYAASQVAKHVSYKTSIIMAYEMAALDDASITIDHNYAGLYVYYRPSRLRELKVGDRIIAINGEQATDHAHEDFLMMAYQDESTWLVERETSDGVESFAFNHVLEEADNPMLFMPNHVINSLSPQINLPGLDSLYGGPSGGAMQTITLYVSLVNINIGPVKIAGTGTMTMAGNVGRIGGLKEKLAAAHDAKVDIFLVPEAHRNDVPDRQYVFEIIYIANTEDIRNVIGALHDNHVE